VALQARAPFSWAPPPPHPPPAGGGGAREPYAGRHSASVGAGRPERSARKQVNPRNVTSIAFAATRALAGFLLFQVQPLLAKYLLPWFGGSASTWLVCLLFFQLALLVGYAHAYAVTLPFPVPR